MLSVYGILLILSWLRTSLQACTSIQYQCPSTQTCLPVSWVCDYYYDCSDNTDEDDPDVCPFPSANMSTAVIYSVNGGSSHLVNLFGDPDRYGWMFGKNSLANSLPLRYTGQLGNPNSTFGPITVDYRTQIVYYGNNRRGLIQYGHLMYMTATDFTQYPAIPVTKQVNSLAFDWAARNLYWIDGEYKFIAVLRADGTTRPPWKVVVGNLSSPKDVAVNPLVGYLFWSDGNGPSAKIERSDLSGNNRVVLVNLTQGLVAPTTLVVDFTSERLYWLDAAASTLGSVNFDGSNVKTWSRTAFSGFSPMTIYKNNIFFGDKTRSRVHVYSKTNVTTFGYKELSRAPGPITDMAMFAADSQPNSDNPCTVDNGNCSQLCFATSSTTRICDCVNGLVLSTDGINCQITEDFLERPGPVDTYEKLLFLCDFNQWNIYQLRPATGEIRTVVMTSYPIALTVDTNRSIIYFIHKDDSDSIYRIRRQSFDGRISESIFNAATGISRLAGLALDNIRSLLYYTDSYLGVVGELSTNGSQNRIIFQDFEEFPRTIIVDSRNGQLSRLYWTDCSQSPSIQTSRVDGTDRRTLTTGSTGSCFTGLAVDFIKQAIYFSNSTNVETSSLNGSLRTTLYSRPGADFSALTIMDDSLIIADRNQRIPVKYNLTTRRLASMQLPPSSAIFSNISDVKFVNFNPGVMYHIRISIVNLIFKPQYSNQSTTEYKTLFSRINTLLVSVYTETLGSTFAYIDDIRFVAGSVIVFNDIQLTSLPSNQMIDRTLTAIVNALIEDSLLVTDANMSSVPFVESMPTRGTTEKTTTRLPTERLTMTSKTSRTPVESMPTRSSTEKPTIRLPTERLIMTSQTFRTPGHVTSTPADTTRNRVLPTDSGSPTDNGTPRSTVIGLAVGLTLGVVFVIVLVIAVSIVICCRRRRSYLPSRRLERTKPMGANHNIYFTLPLNLAQYRQSADGRTVELVSSPTPDIGLRYPVIVFTPVCDVPPPDYNDVVGCHGMPTDSQL